MTTWFVYKPEGADPKRWEFDPSKLMSPEAEAIERHTKMTYAEACIGASQGSMTALHGFLFVLLKRGNPTLKWEQVEFSISEIDMEDDEDDEPDADEDADTDEDDGDPKDLAS